MDFRVLGPLEVIRDGVPIELSARRPRALLALLLLRPGEVVSVDALMDAIWDGRPPATAASVLRVYVTQVRRALGEGRIVTKPPGYVLDVEKDEIDAHRFELLLADGRRALAEGNIRLARSLHGRALELWRGDALADLATESFTREFAARLNELRAVCLEGRLEADLALGNHALVLPELEQLVAEHPLRERLRGQLMLALYRTGRQADALACYRDGRTALVDELGLEPSAELRELERRILEHDPTLGPSDDVVGSATAAGHRVPAPQSPTIGRDPELAQLREGLLQPGTRLVTLLGPGGIGKTRLALEVARRLQGELADGAALVDLASIDDPTHLLPAIGTALGLREAGPVPWQELLTSYLAERELLLVLDNFEHLVDGAAPVSALLESAPRLTVLATSRRPLRLSPESVLEVGPLSGGDASTMLAERAAAAGASIDQHDHSLDAIVERLEGLPLAIELAAPWLRTLPPHELLGLLDSRLELLAGGSRDAPARQRTMRSVIEWSFKLLEPDAQHLLGRLSAFRSEFTTDGALEVGGPGASVEQLAMLVDASIVRSRNGAHRMLDVVRDYARELPSADDVGRSLHANHFLALAEAAETGLTGSDQASWLERLERQHDDLRASLDWLGEHGEPALVLRLAAALGRFWYIRGHLSEGLERLQRAVAIPQSDAPALAKALRGASALALLRGQYASAQSYAERALDSYRVIGDEFGVARCLSNLGAILHARGDLDLAAETLDECVRVSEALADERLIALARNNRGDVALSQGEFDLAADQFARSLTLLRDADDAANVARALYNLGAVSIEQRRTDDARAFIGESIDLAVQVDDREDVAWCMIALAAIAIEDAAPREAASLLGFTEVLLERIGATMKPFEQHLFARTVDRARAALGRDAFREARTSGAQLNWNDAIRIGREAVGSGAYR